MELWFCNLCGGTVLVPVVGYVKLYPMYIVRSDTMYSKFSLVNGLPAKSHI
ncbi:hypothetical protein AG1IA_09478 [Rhizoctonia solani AG-1 IA]|uniref:Uncharacterized protein n=1 Tax=Thanatephorus cucumeris (strain AG1-IA) TaxID=983506 RepID=L8WI66_THACA|nr:hypothetical protein AG1IA_09478 [Rhizoctonia solani AG-1 IA]